MAKASMALVDDDEGIEDVADEELIPGTPDVDDVDPLDWLAHASASIRVEKYFVASMNKNLKLASISDEESDRVRRASMRPNRRTNRMLMDASIFRRELIAMSINKAYGRSKPSDHNYLIPETLSKLPVGTLNDLLKEVMRISGVVDDTEKVDASDVFG